MKEHAITYDVEVIDEKMRKKHLSIPAERPLTLYVNKKELLTIMTLGANTRSLIIGYLRNQRLVKSLDEIESIQIDWEVNAAVVKTKNTDSNIDTLTGKVTLTSGCGQGTMFGDVTAELEKFQLGVDLKLKQSDLLEIIDEVRMYSSIYKQAGSVHGCALFKQSKMLFYCEDVGRHNAVDAIAGKMWEFGLEGKDLLFYTTGRLTSEMVIKGAQMHIPFLLSRSGVTQMGVEMARNVNMTLLGRCSGKHFYVFNGVERLIFDLLD